MNPSLLQHLYIPKPMHGISPRVIMGQEWWDAQRQIAYRAEDFCCWACGVHKSQAMFHRWLEAHETYEIDYAQGKMVFRGVVALCHACHNFIHLGRLQQLLEAGEISQAKFNMIVQHGYRVLAEAGLEPWWGTRALIEPGYKRVEKQPIAAWESWRLVFNVKEYLPVFASHEEWQKFYRDENRA